VQVVVEGVGDHGCEYMTGGSVVILGDNGRNFAAGMSGGVAYVWDVNKTFVKNCNMEMVLLDTLENKDEALLKKMILSHHEFTQSKIAAHILSYWQTAFKHFVKVMPTDYKAVLRKNKVSQLANASICR
jgi:glutamate synthase (NADPH/NADH) large chain